MSDDEETVERIVNSTSPALVVHSRWRDRLDYFLIGAVLFLLFGLSVLGLVAYNARQSAHDDASKLNSVSKALGVANQRIERLGGTPVTTPAPPAVAAPVSDSRLLSTVAEYFSQHPIATPTIDYEQLQGYVYHYLSLHPAPRGASGANASPEQVAAAVTAYFTAHPPQPGPPGPAGSPGSPGPAGSPGPTGSPGRGITTIDCSSKQGVFSSGDVSFRITYSDGTVQTVTCSNNTGSGVPS